MPKMIQQSSRILWADILKFWGIFAIVWGHTLGAGVVRHYIYSFHVPLFFFLIGVYFQPKEIYFGRFVQKKALTLLVPYFGFAIISILIFSVFGQMVAKALNIYVADFSLRANLLEMLSGQCRANRPLWFLPCVFVFYILCWGLTKSTEKLKKPLRMAVFAVVIAGSIALCVLNGKIFKIHALFWKADAAIFMLCFFVVAIWMRPLFARQITMAASLIMAALLLLTGGVLAFQNSAVGYMSNSYGNVWIFYGSSICTILGFCCLSMFVARLDIQIVNKVLAYVGKRTLPILLMHKFPILFFQAVVPFTKGLMKKNDPYVGFVVAIVSIVCCLIVDQIGKKIFDILVLKTRREKQSAQ